MKNLGFLIVATVVGVIFWRITDSLSTDAIGLAVGVVFGVLAGLPAAVLVMAVGRSREKENVSPRSPVHREPFAPPVVIINQIPEYKGSDQPVEMPVRYWSEPK